jgi:hypothetical protein
LSFGDLSQTFPESILKADARLLSRKMMTERFGTDDFTSPSSCWFVSDATVKMAAAKKPIHAPNIKQVAQLIITIATTSSFNQTLFVIHRITSRPNRAKMMARNAQLNLRATYLKS